MYVCACGGGEEGGGQEFKIWHNSNQLLCVCVIVCHACIKI